LRPGAYVGTMATRVRRPGRGQRTGKECGAQ
jgi:hypothetical protein